MSKTKIINIQETAIKKFFRNNILNFREFPDDEIKEYFMPAQKKNYEMNLEIIESETLREEFRKFLMCIFEHENPYPYTSRIFNILFSLPEILNEIGWNSFYAITEQDIESFIECMHKHNLYTGKNNTLKIRRTLNHIPNTLKYFADTRTGLDRDTWYFKDLNLPAERLNKTNGTKCIDFSGIKNVHNREMVKLWFRHLLGGTELATATLLNTLTWLKGYCNSIGDMPIETATRTEVMAYIKTLDSLSNNVYNKALHKISDFYAYLAVKEIYKLEAPVLQIDYKNNPRKHYYNSVSEHVMLQMFRHIYELPSDLLLMYLINFSTGLRVSDICQLQRDCLIKSEKCYFIRFHMQKMQKDHAVPVSTALGELIEERIKEISKLKYKEQYLFFSKENTPRATQWYRKNMKKWCKKWEIKNEDGTDYNFLPHSYRHTLATSLSTEFDVDLEIIQLVVLGHSEIQMTLCYIDKTDEYKKMVNDNYVNVAGLNTTLDVSDSLNPDWIKKNLTKQVLPNGLCAYPCALGVCPNQSACLDCEYFRTSKRYLEVHKQQLAKIEESLVLFRANNWVNNIATAEAQKETLIRIINSLENS
ncbi:MAG: site-specific integrase [Agathobacter sp.]|nr:site-specific integrase [Agathobacter sp.]